MSLSLSAPAPSGDGRLVFEVHSDWRFKAYWAGGENITFDPEGGGGPNDSLCRVAIEEVVAYVKANYAHLSAMLDGERERRLRELAEVERRDPREFVELLVALLGQRDVLPGNGFPIATEGDAEVRAYADDDPAVALRWVRTPRAGEVADIGDRSRRQDRERVARAIDVEGLVEQLHSQVESLVAHPREARLLADILGAMRPT